MASTTALTMTSMIAKPDSQGARTGHEYFIGQ
jgi:hypothetical protein